MNNRPNFFIIGGPKCGTTAMSKFLKAHPDVFMCEPKEPNYFADDMPGMKYVDTEKGYNRLFNKANHKIVGDASIFYMYSEIAIKNIYQNNPNAKLLVMLRNPIEMAPSFHQQIVFTLDEDDSDFESALNKESQRKQGDLIPKHCRAKKLLFYSEIAKYGKQLENVFKFFPRENVKILFFEDFKKSNKLCYQEVLEFLGVKDDGRMKFERVNDAKKAKSTFINKIVNRPPKFLVFIARLIRRVLNKPRLGILNRLDHLNRGKLDKEDLSLDVKNRLLDIYENDIQKLEKILKVDLNHWR